MAICNRALAGTCPASNGRTSATPCANGKAAPIAASQPGNEMVAALAYEGMASAASFKKNFPEACKQLDEANKIYAAKGAGQPLIDRANGIGDAANCKKTDAKADPKAKAK